MERLEAPPISALFLVVFDQKVGYTIAWKRSLPDVDLDGVEFQCLPSGLHSVQSDLVYFIHGQYAGVSAFQQEESDAQHRNATFVTVGALVPLSYGRLGRSWLHAEALRRLAGQVVKDTKDTDALDSFWKECSQHTGDSAASSSPSSSKHRASTASGAQRSRALSDATTMETGGTISADHPALSLPTLLNSFGPLIFPLHRAALLRKRILFLGHTPVQPSCNHVYNLSVLSTIPHSLSEVVLPSKESLLRIHPLFSIGIHDIDAVEGRDRAAGWLACTTDDILKEKKRFYGLVVELPSSTLQKWPVLRTSEGAVVKASQKDLRRYNSLRRELRRFQHMNNAKNGRYQDDGDDDSGAAANGDAAADGDDVPLIQKATTSNESSDVDGIDYVESEVVEPISWAALAYRSFMWWASAGEQDTWDAEEASADNELLKDIPSIEEALSQSTGDASREQRTFRNAQDAATVLVAYFHRLTHATISTLADAVEAADDDTEEGIEEDAIEIGAEDFRRMGIDTWTERDRLFVTEAMKLWFDREATVVDDGLRMCGVRIC